MMLREMQRICCIFAKIKRVTMEDSMAKDSKLNQFFKTLMGLLFFWSAWSHCSLWAE